MAKNYTAYEAAKELYGTDKKEIAEIGAKFPLFARTVCLINDEVLLDILAALNVTARQVETGLKDLKATDTDEVETEDVEEVEETEEADDSGEDLDLESMTTKDLYALCCKRGISSKVKSRKKTDLIAALRGETSDNDDKKASKKAKADKKAEKVEEVADEEDWEDEEPDDPYAGKTAKELYKLCTERKIKTKPKQKADVYAALLKKADEAAEESPEDEDEDEDEWEI